MVTVAGRGRQRGRGAGAVGAATAHRAPGSVAAVGGDGVLGHTLADGDIVKEQGVHVGADIAPHDEHRVTGRHREGGHAVDVEGVRQGLAEYHDAGVVAHGPHLVGLRVVGTHDARLPRHGVCACHSHARRHQPIVGLCLIDGIGAAAAVVAVAIDDAPGGVVLVVVAQRPAGGAVLEVHGVW